MSDPQGEQLWSELQAVGASATESQELIRIASRLRHLNDDAAVHTDATRDKRHHRGLRTILIITIPTVMGMTLGMVLVIASQTVLPGSPLYPVQFASDTVAASFVPSYRGTIMMKRAMQVQQLVYSRAPSDEVSATLADYRKEASGYRSATSNYAALEYCKTTLQEAAAQAPGTERQAIDAVLVSLSDV